MGAARVQVQGPRLVERDQELAAIEAGLEMAASGVGATLLIEGPPGIGKTSLLASARASAEGRGMPVLHARATQLESDFAMGIVRQALEPLVRASDQESLFAGAAALSRGVLLEVSEEATTPALGVLHGLYWLVAGIADRAPVLIVIDDLQWADEPSLRFLAYLARRVESLPALLLLASRESEGSADRDVVIEGLRTEPSTVLRPRPLGLAGIEAVLSRSRPGPVHEAFSRACLNASGGNPFLLAELVRALRDGQIEFTAAGAERLAGIAPSTVARRVRATLARLGSGASGFARAVAVLGDDVELDAAAELAGVPVAEAARIADELTRAGVLDDGSSVRFLHPLLGGAVRSDIPAQERAEAHARAAELLRRRGAGLERVALHLIHTRPSADATVVDGLVSAATVARRRGAPATAVALLRRALAEPPPAASRASVLLELGLDEYAVGQTADAAEHLGQALRCAPDPRVRGRALMGLFQARAGDFAGQRGLEPLFVDTVPEVLGCDRELGLLLWTLKLLAVEPGPKWDEAARGVELLSGETPGEAILRGHWALPIVSRATTAEALAPIAARAASHADVLLEQGATALVMTGVVLGLTWTEQFVLAEDVLGRAIRVAERRGAISDLAVAYQFRASLRRRAGQLRDAEADAQTALAAAAGAGWGGAGRTALTMLVGSLLDQGRTQDAASEMAGVDAVPDAPSLNQLLIEQMRLRAAQGQHRQALAAWDEARRRAVRHFTGIDPSWVPDLLAAADSHHALGEVDERDALLSEAVALAEHWGTPGFIGQARHRMARLRGGEDAVGDLAGAVEVLRGSPARLELARALLSLGEVLRRHGRRVQSRDPLREAYDLARQCGANGLAETARAELRASGIRLRREALSGVDALTAGERRIADMAASGASNAEIAQTLFLTVKTVESHLTSCYRKLDISRRSQLQGALEPKSQGRGSGSSPSRSACG